MKIYCIKPNTVHPDAMFFLKSEMKKRFADAEIVENQTGPRYDPSMITNCDLLAVAVDKTRSIGKGVYGEIVTARARKIVVTCFEYDEMVREMKEISNFVVKVTDSENYRNFGLILDDTE